MIAITTPSRFVVSQPTAEAFEAMLPAIERVASHRFRRVPRHRRAELISDAVAMAYVAFVALVARGESALVYPSILAGYAVRQIQDGRQAGSRQNTRDVLSWRAQRKHGFSVQPLEQQTVHCDWEEFVVDRKANPAEIAACRVDFRDWLGRLKQFKRRVALRLAAGDTTGDAARYFRLTPARISQLRKLLHQDWNKFQAVSAVA